MSDEKKQPLISRLAYGNTRTDGRAHLFDNVKFLLIILVVVGHFIDDLTEPEPLTQSEELNDTLHGIFLFIYAFHMPAFLFISGLFSKKDTDRFNWQPVKVYFILGFMLKMLVGFGQMLFDDEMTGGYFSVLSGDGVYWYLFVLAGYRIITYAARNIDSRFVMIFSIALALMTGYDTETDEWMSLSRLIVFFPIYYAGCCLTPKSVQRFCKKWYIRILSAAAFVTWGYLCFFRFRDVRYFRRLFTGKNPYDVVQLPNTEFWDRAAAMLISAVLITAVISLVPSFVIPFFTKFGSRTLQVYFWHRPLLYYILYTEIFPEYIFIKLPNHWWWAAVMISVAAAFLLSAEIFGRPLSSCIKMMKKSPAKK